MGPDQQLGGGDIKIQTIISVCHYGLCDFLNFWLKSKVFCKDHLKDEHGFGDDN